MCSSDLNAVAQTIIRAFASGTSRALVFVSSLAFTHAEIIYLIIYDFVDDLSPCLQRGSQEDKEDDATGTHRTYFQ